ncbi:TonB-dependent receptor plug domain-containing protein [Sphingobacterium sp. LRF_L2]|uniref:TonB-dependent receptor n=1 Tax=Sphingobacterium sp. LRF_L2 TaxID=3369421 RepID=UPI003F5FB363
MVIFLINNCYRISLTLILLFALGSVQAQQSFVVMGRVLDESGMPLDGVTVKIAATAQHTITDKTGNFRFSVAKATSYKVELSNIGFVTQHRTLVAQSTGKSVIQDITLKADAREMETVSVDGRSEVRQLKEQGFAVNAIDTRKLANSTADLNQILNRSTGVKVREQGGMGSDFEFSVNGLSGSAVKFFLDGVPMDVMGSTMALNNIPVNLADRIEVYKGVAPIELGSDALGGAVNIVSKNSLSNYLDVSHSYGSFQTNQSSLNAQYVHQPTGLVVKASGFFNYSKNNYMMHDVEAVENMVYVSRDLRRFHDRYRSGMGRLEVGLTNKSWADALFIGFAYTEFDKQIQTGVKQSIVYGDVTRDGSAKTVSLRYNKTGLLDNRLDVSLFANYSKDHTVVTDTLFRKYNWFGTYNASASAETGRFGLMTINRPRYFARANASFKINDKHKIGANYTFDQIENQSYNAYDTDFDDMPGKIGKHIVGISYQQESFGRWTNTFMAKYYGLQTTKTQYNYDIAGLEIVRGSKPYFGYGIASVYKVTHDFGIKGSYENTYRLQDVNEMFGDGIQIANNLELKPESSRNVNLGLYYGIRSGKHDWFVEGLGTYRYVEDFIAPQQFQEQIKYENLANVFIRGLEGEMRYGYSDWLSVMVNMTYQQALDDSKFVDNDPSLGESNTYGGEVPNRPWLFGNFDLGLSKNNFLKAGNRLQFSWMTQFTEWYYLSWEKYATPNSIEKIPSQLSHSAIVSYAMQDGKYNVSFECRNLTDELLFDNFRLQKAGRAFYVKLRYSIFKK